MKDKAIIVVGVDYSQNSNDALEVACGFTGPLADVTLHLVHVTTARATQPFAGMNRRFAVSLKGAPLDDLQAEKRELDALTLRVAASVAKNAARLFGHLRTGNAAREIVQLASDVSADLIVVGTQGRTDGMKPLLGSVAQNVLTNAFCPVLVVRPKGLPRWPAIAPPCPDCVAVQKVSRGQRLWCDRYSQHHASAYTYSVHPDHFGRAQKFRGLT
jgi:nucleotide-binding universal stress UspA family protein